MNKKYIGSDKNLLNIYEIEGVEGETTVREIEYFSKFDCQVLITEEKTQDNGSWYNIYIIHEAFKVEPMNNLYLQEPKENGIPSDLQLELYVIQYYLWHKHNKDFSITFEEIPE
jgi:hypothetical protein